MKEIKEVAVVKEVSLAAADKYDARARTWQEKNQLMRIIAQDPGRVTYARQHTVHPVLSEYDIVFVDDQKTNFVRCRKCHKLIVFKGSSYVTNLKTHKCLTPIPAVTIPMMYATPEQEEPLALVKRQRTQ